MLSFESNLEFKHEFTNTWFTDQLINSPNDASMRKILPD